MNLDNFLSTIFDANDATCFADNPYGHRVYKSPVERDVLFAINSLYLDRDLSPTQEWHNPKVGRRADSNVTKYATFLLELDTMALSEQVKYVRDLVPVTSVVSSGGKSHHCLIRLVDPLPDYETYMDVSRRLHKLVPKADPSTKNPSRLSRLPFRVRPETGLEQKLIYLGGRIPNSELLSILPTLPKASSFTHQQRQARVSIVLMQAILEPDSIMSEYNLGGRNAFFYFLGQRMKEANIDVAKKQEYVDMAYSNLKNQSGFSLTEAYFAARVKL